MKKLLELKLIGCFALMMIVIGCARDEIVPMEELPTTKRLIVTSADIPQVTSALLEKIGLRDEQDRFSANTGQSIDDLGIKWDKVMHLIDTTGKETYTFAIEDQDFDPFTFYNLVLRYDEFGTAQEPYLLKYTMDESFIPVYAATRSLENFNGTVKKIRLSQQGTSVNRRGSASFGGERTSSSGDEDTCDGSGVTSGGNNNGGGSNDTNDPTDPSTGGLGLSCTTYSVTNTWYSQACGGGTCEEPIITGRNTSIYTVCTRESDAGEAAGEGEDDCNPGDGEIPILDIDENIDDSLLDPCHSRILYNLIYSVGKDGVNKVMRKFSGISYDNYDWRIQYGNVTSNTSTAATNSSLQDGWVVTNIDRSRVSNSSDMSMARTIVHEAVHAFLVNYFRDDPQAATKEYSELANDFIRLQGENTTGAWTEANHNEMVRSWIGDIATTLEAFGKLKGYDFTSSYYQDLAWGGLTGTDAFDKLLETEKTRINNTVRAELFGTYNGTVAKGEKACE